VLEENEADKKARMINIFDYICRHSTNKWATKFLLDLKH
jgi:trehalose-6-phosphate synthase